MKTNLTRKLRSAILCLALLAAAIPFAASAQAGAKPDAVQETTKEPAEQKAEVKTSADAKEIRLDLDGKICRGEFIFEGNTIRFSKGNSDPMPMNITVDLKHWDDLSKPFELDYTPDFAKAGILQRDSRGPRAYSVNVAENKFTLQISDDNTSPDPFHVKLAMKNQIPHDIIPWYRSSPKNTIGLANISMLYNVEAANQKSFWNDCIKERKIILKAIIGGRGTFVFEGNKIQYQHEGGKQPDLVTINGRGWAFLERPFELPFQIDTAHPEMAKNKGGNAVELSKINEQRFEVYFNDSEPTSGTPSTVYTVTITPGEEPETK